MSDSEDDKPLIKAKSKKTVSKGLDQAMDRDQPSTNGHVPGISMANGPVDAMDIDHAQSNGTHANGSGKRKAALGKNPQSDRNSDDEGNAPLQKRQRTQPSKSSDDDDQPLSKKALPPKATAAQMGEESDDDIPLGKQLQQKKAKIEKKAEDEAKALRQKDKTAGTKLQAKKDQSDSDDDAPLIRKKAPATVKKGMSGSDSEDDAPLIKKNAPAAVKKDTVKKETNGTGSKIKKEDVDDRKLPLSKKQSRRVAKKEDTPTIKSKARAKSKKQAEEDDEEAEEEEDEYRWWEDPDKRDGTIKWSHLEHNGVVFPPDYESLPPGVHLLYNGEPVTMNKDAEEIAHAFGSMLSSTHNVENPTFQKNFFHDFKEVLDKTGHAKDKDGNKVKITDFKKCDFTKIHEHTEAERQAKKALPKAEKARMKAEKDKFEAPFTHCLWDGRKQKVGNFRVEPPGLFRGRGEHPKTGKFKRRVAPEQITINIGEEATVPKPPDGHRWKEVKHDQEGTWLATWQENINGAYKYVMLAASSDVKGKSDFNKFEKARELKKHIDKIRKDYTHELKAEQMGDRQRATAVYLIDQFALRAGNEKGEDEADTVGCCSLKFEHVTLKPPDTVIFDFLGKDSIRFYDEVKVSPQVFKNLKIFKRAPKHEGDEIFDRLTTSSLNKHLAAYMSGLTAKVFRTYNASWTMNNLLQDMKSKGSIPEKVKDYNDANRKVAILCNHKRTVPAAHEKQMEKMEDKINGLRYQQYRLKQQMLDLDPKLKKAKGAEFFKLPEELDEDWVKKHQEALVEEQRVKIRKKFEKDNEKRATEGEPEMKAKELDERMEVADEMAEKFKSEWKKGGKIQAEGRSPTVEKLEVALEKLDQRAEAMKVQAEDRDNNKEVALGTSKINYIDPRLTVVFSKKFDVPIERFFSKQLREKFEWAIKSVDEDWEF